VMYGTEYLFISIQS